MPMKSLMQKKNEQSKLIVIIVLPLNPETTTTTNYLISDNKINAQFNNNWIKVKVTTNNQGFNDINNDDND